VPLVFFFDEGISRVELQARVGLTDRTDLLVQLPIQSHYGGWLDRVIEGVHALGFRQFGRDLVAADQRTLVVMEHGVITFFNQERIRAKPQDPTVGVVHRLLEQGPWRLSLHASLKPPLTATYHVYRSGWDPTVALSGRWEPSPRHVLYGGAGFVARLQGSTAYDEAMDRGFRHGTGAHLGWEYRPGRLRPFFQLVWQSGWLRPMPYQKLDRPSLQHDAGFHWQLRSDLVFTFRYLNNLTHNANTADMGVGLSLTLQL